MTAYVASALAGDRHVLAEGPVWLPGSASVLWVDIERGQVFEGRLGDGEVEVLSRLDFSGRVGAAVRGDRGSLAVAIEDRLLVIAPDASRSEGPILVTAGVNSRVNDGACDPAGRLLVGTLALDDRTGVESLYRWEADGSLTVIDADLTLSNGVAFSPDGTLMYSTDTVPGIIWVREYDVATGRVGARREHLHIDTGYPDGICMDARGHLWVAIWGEGEVRSFDLEGRPGDTVSVAAPHVSSVAFVGERLDRLLITTASRDLSPEELVALPDAGRLFLADVGVLGQPVALWAEPTPIASVP